MEKVRLGRTNLIVKKLGWGGIPIQRVSEQEAISVVQSVVEMGVELLDTARGYTTSEQRIGMALQNTKTPVILSSKSPVRTEKIYNEVHESLRQLQVRKINIYHLHNVSKVEDYEKVMGPGGAYEGLTRAKAEGLIDHIGLTSHSLDLLERVLQEDHFDVIMACYSFLEPDSAQKIFPLARAKDVGVLTMKPFSGGVIEEGGPALRFVLATPDVVPIPGSETLARARENWDIFTKGHSLSGDDQARIQQVRQQFDRQFCRRCDYCQPCSEGINIQLMMGLKSVIRRFGSPDEISWIKGLMEKGRNCTECGDCLPRCPYQLPIPELIKKNLAWYDSLIK
ncbi:MAG: aldo/keto reductase [Thermodesulfobacteriota bacterium]|nr:aldo/keto reductase [Thermodesulfobacteriota bacterium]